jgi:hypothetical protein
VQQTVIPGLLVVMALLAVALWRLMRGTLARSLAALVLAVGFIAIRAIGFHHVDVLYRYAEKTGRDAPAAELAVERAGPVHISLAGLRLLLRKSAKALDPEMPR